MLNIKNIIDYTPEEEKHIEKTLLPIIKRGGDAWNDKKNQTIALKTRIRDFLRDIPKNRCVYCEMVIARKGGHIEHFIARNIIRSYSFEPQNLFFSCSSCNSRAIKNDHGIIIEPGNKKVYEMNTFLIVHPYLHNPEDHFFYVDPEKRVIFDNKKCSQLAINTINLFKWNDKSAIEDRAEASLSRKYEKEKQDLVNKAILFKSNLP